MGEVYKARDTRLDREVAIKTARQEFNSRFQREARAISALNHPYICTLYDVGPNYLVMEYVDGEPPMGPLALDEAFRIARQIADALDCAHEHGITHRDLKPANIKIARNGNVKVLDFGLAKIHSSAPEVNPDHSPTMTLEATLAGVVLGTAAYMAPEQAKGLPADKRSDIWSFGVVLFELITGEQAFAGDTISDTLAAVLKTEVDLSRVPLKARRLLAACLEKDPKRRLRDIGDAWQILEETPSTPVRSGMTRLLPWAIAGVLAIGLGVAVLWRSTGEPLRRIELSLQAPEGGSFYFNAPPSVSPDGRSVALGAVVDGRSSLWIRELDSTTARPLADTAGASKPAWSPDGRSIAFAVPFRSFKRIDLAAGTVRTICDLPLGFGGASWGAADTIVFTDPKGTWRVPASGGTPTLLAARNAETEVWHQNPWFLPDGHHFLINISGRKAEDNAIYGGDIDYKGPVRNWRRILATRRASVTYAQGYLMYLRERTLMAQPFNTERLETTGDALPVAEQVDNNQGWTRWGVSQNGVLAFTSGVIGPEQLTWYDRSGKVLGVIGPADMILTVAISPDGSTLATDRMDESVGSDIWLHDLSRGSESRFTSGYARRPVWSPDGGSIAYTSRDGAYQKSRAGGPEQKVGEGWIWDWSSDGRYMIIEITAPKTRRDIWIKPMFGDRKVFPYLQTEFDEREGKFSPDVRWIAYASNETGRPEIYVQGFSNPGEKFQVSTSGGGFPLWSRDGKELFFLSADHKMMAAEVKAAGGKFQAGIPKVLFATRAAELPDVTTPYDVTKDGRFLMVTPQNPPGRPMTVMINWTVGLKKVN
jgi:Tol biopolymer transport system component